MSAKDDLAFVEELQDARQYFSPRYTTVRIVQSDYARLLALAERGARFTPEHEAVIEAAQPWGTNAQWCECRMCTMLASAVTALNEQREKEGER